MLPLAKVAELVDAHDSKSCSFGSVGSIPTFGTNKEMEKTVIVGLVNRNQNQKKSQEYLDELEFLSITAGGVVEKRFTQRIETPNPSTLIGKGKMDEIGTYVKAKNIQTKRNQNILAQLNKPEVPPQSTSSSVPPQFGSGPSRPIIPNQKKEPVKIEKKIGRNDKVTIQKGSDTKIIKYKKIQEFVNSGWTLSDK